MCYMEELDEPLRRGVLPPDAIEVKAEPGDVLLFPDSLWHAVAPNTKRVRKTFIFRYGHLWHRPHGDLTQPAEVLDRMSPRLRRMLGDFGDHPRRPRGRDGGWRLWWPRLIERSPRSARGRCTT